MGPTRTTRTHRYRARIEWGRDRDGTLSRTASPRNTGSRESLEAEQVEPTGQLERPASLQDGEELNPLPVMTSADIPKRKPGRGRKKLAQLKKIEERIATISKSSNVYAGTFRQPAPTRRMHRGDPLSPKEVVAPEGLDVLNSKLKPLRLKPDAPERGSSNRLCQVAD